MLISALGADPSDLGYIGAMTVVKINALQIPPAAGDEIVKRFTARMEALSDTPGFLGFELLRPTADTETRWFVYTRWEDEASFRAWRDGEGARNAHAGEAASSGGHPGSAGGHPGGAGGHPGGDNAGGQGGGPVSMGASLLEFEVEVTAGPSGV